MRVAVAADHGIQLDEVYLAAPGSVPKTSSGKIQRRLCRSAFLGGELPPAVEPADRVGPSARAEPAGPADRALEGVA